MKRHPQLFIICSQKDDDLLQELVRWLLPSRRLIEFWHPGLLAPGEAGAPIIERRLSEADLIVLLVSIDLFTDCGDLLEQALRRYHLGETRCLPVLLRAIDWTLFPASLAALTIPGQDRGVKQCPDRDEAWRLVMQRIQRTLEGVMRPIELEEFKVTLDEFNAGNTRLTLIGDIDDAIATLNFCDHLDPFRLFLESSRQHIGAFLLYGDTGPVPRTQATQRWLYSHLRRLLNDRDGSSRQHLVIVHPCDSNARAPALEPFLRTLASRLRIRTGAWTDLIQALCQRWFRQDVILVLDGIQVFDEGMVEELMERFWRPLTAEARRQSQLPETCLLLFMISYSHKPCKTATADFADPTSLVQLPQVGAFSAEEVRSWLKQTSRLPSRRLSVAAERRMLDDHQGGVPYDVFSDYCQLRLSNLADEQQQDGAFNELERRWFDLDG